MLVTSISAAQRVHAHRAMRSLPDLVAFVEDESVPATPRAYALCVEYGWTPTPLRSLDRERWVSMFSRFGFLTNVEGCSRPTKLVRLYRAATAEFARGLSWSDSRAYAEHYLTRRPGAGPHNLFTLTVEPEWILAIVQRTGRDGRPKALEWIVDLPLGASIALA